MTEKAENDPSKLAMATVKSKCRPQSARAVLQTVSFSQKLRAQANSLVPIDKPMRPTPNPGETARHQTNTQALHRTKQQRHNAAMMRKSLAELEEEVKVLNRAKHAIEVALQNTRKQMAVNHQALTMRERMHKHMQHGAAVQSLQQESAVLSKSKRDLESCLQTTKHQAQELDHIRRSLQTQLSALSRTLDMSNNAFCIYQSSPKQVSKRPHYEMSCHPPQSSREGSWETSHGITSPSSKFQDVIRDADTVQAASQSVRQQLRHLLVEHEEGQKHVQEKVTHALKQEVDQLKSQKRDMMMERGEVRVARNMALRLQTQQEMALGLTLGPHNSRHRLVAQREDRPLAKCNDSCTASEHKAISRASARIEKDMTATRSSVNNLDLANQSLAFGVQSKRAEIEHKTQILQLRKKAADNRWVQ